MCCSENDPIIINPICNQIPAVKKQTSTLQSLYIGLVIENFTMVKVFLKRHTRRHAESRGFETSHKSLLCL